jgi:pilus assembly protein Flp/PilA
VSIYAAAAPSYSVECQLGASLGANGERKDLSGSTRATEPIMRRFIEIFIADASGATAIEYALIGSLIAIVLVGALTALGTGLSSEFGEVSSAMK